MRFVHIVPAISEEANGPSYSVSRLCEALIAADESVTLAVLDLAPMQRSISYLKKFPLGLGPKKLGCSPTMKKWLEREAIDQHIRIIHNHGLWMMPNVYPGQIAKRRNIPMVASPRGTLSKWAMANGSVVKKVFWPFVQRPALGTTTCFHATADTEYYDIRAAGFNQPVAIIPNGVDLPEWKARPCANSKTLLFLSRIHPKKGVDLLLAAWRAVMNKFPDWQLRIVGPDNDGYLAQMQKMASELNLQRVEFVGPLYGVKKWQAYQEAQLFVLPTHSENFGMSVAEALAAGTPVIVTKGAPWQEVNAYQAGWWIEIGLDPLVTSLEEAMDQDSEKLREMGLRGRAWMEQEFSWPRIGKMMLQTYKWILEGGVTPKWVKVK